MFALLEKGCQSRQDSETTNTHHHPCANAYLALKTGVSGDAGIHMHVLERQEVDSTTSYQNGTRGDRQTMTQTLKKIYGINQIQVYSSLQNKSVPSPKASESLQRLEPVKQQCQWAMALGHGTRSHQKTQ
jgi:hypothetical protein